MDEFDKDQVIEWYGWIELSLLEIMKILPPSPENLEAHSPRLATLILDACGLLDSIFRQITPDPVNVGSTSKSRNQLDIADFAELYSDKFRLSKLKSIPFISPPRYISPFEDWEGIESGGEYKPLPWWNDHTKLKHDRIAHLKRAGLENAILSLCALHQVISIVRQFKGAIFRAGWINTTGINPEMLLEHLEKEAPVPQHYEHFVETRLFMLLIASNVPDDINALRPAGFNASNRVIQFFGRWF